MSDTKITGMPAAAALTGTEVVAGVQGGANVKIDLNAVKDFAVTLNGNPGDPAGPLDGSGKIPTSQLPPLDHDVGEAADEAEMLALPVTAPAICIRTDFTPAHVFYLTADPATDVNNWVDTGEFGAGAANPTASVGLAAINGVANTYMRSDAAPALSQAIVPTWTGIHTFNGSTSGSTPSIVLGGTQPELRMYDPSAAVGQKYWRVRGSGGGFFLQTADDTGINSGSYGIVFLRSGTMISQVQIMALNNPLTLTGTDATLWSGYTPANPLSIATKAYVDGATSVTPANPSAQVGTAAINGVATTYMRSDAAPAINQAMTPTWTGLHTHNTAVHINNPGGDAFIVTNSTITGPTATISTASSGGSALSTLLLKSTSVSGGASLGFTNTSLGTDLKTWDIYQSDTTFNFRTSNDANSSNATWLTATRAAAAIAGIASNSGTGAWTHTGTLAVTGNVNVQGNISSTANLNPAGPTNSGAQLVAAPSLATIGFWDSTRTVNNRYAEWIWFEGALQARFKNDAGSSAVTPLSFTGGQAGGITAIASNSGSGAWTHTGAFSTTGTITASDIHAPTTMTLSAGSTDPGITIAEFVVVFGENGANGHSFTWLGDNSPWTIKTDTGTPGQVITSTGNATSPVWGPVLASGPYAPTVTPGTNVASATANGDFMYMRLGDIVQISGSLDVTASGVGPALVQFSLPVPVANFADTHKLSGSGAATNGTEISPAYLRSLNGAQLGVIDWIAPSTASHTMRFQAMYTLAP